MPSRAGKPSQVAHRHKLLFAAAGAVGLFLLGAIVGLIVLFSGVMTTAATQQHFAITHQLLDAGLRLSVRSAARDVSAPTWMSSDAAIAQGAACFEEHCALCHGAPGTALSPAAQGMLPVPTSLSAAAKEWSASQLYYITKKGIRMTGMPAWEFRLSEQSLWSTVGFLQILSQVDRAQYLDLISARAHCRPNVTSPTQTSPTQTSPTQTSRQRGDLLFRQYACHSCHRIEGVVGPNVRVGPPLVDWPRQKFIAGVLPNSHANLVRWITAPHAVSPATLMPDLDVAEAHAVEMATFLLTQQ